MAEAGRAQNVNANLIAEMVRSYIAKTVSLSTSSGI